MEAHCKLLVDIICVANPEGDLSILELEGFSVGPFKDLNFERPGILLEEEVEDFLRELPPNLVEAGIVENLGESMVFVLDFFVSLICIDLLHFLDQYPGSCLVPDQGFEQIVDFLAGVCGDGETVEVGRRVELREHWKVVVEHSPQVALEVGSVDVLNVPQRLLNHRVALGVHDVPEVVQVVLVGDLLPNRL